MKKLVNLVVVLYCLLLGVSVTAQTNSKEANAIIRKNAVKQMTTRELANNRSQMTFASEISSNIFSETELNKLAGGQIVGLKTWKFNLLEFHLGIFPLASRDVYEVAKYKNIGGVVKKINSHNIIGSAESAPDVSIISFYLPILIILLFPYFSASKINRKLTSALTIFTLMWILVSIFLGIVMSAVITNGLVILFVTVALLLVTIFYESEMMLRTIIAAGIIIATSAGVFSGRLSILGANPFSSEFIFIWQYVGLYVVAAALGSFIMWAKKIPDDKDQYYSYLP